MGILNHAEIHKQMIVKKNIFFFTNLGYSFVIFSNILQWFALFSGQHWPQA